MPRVTVADVAEAAGVGLSTVDRVMNGRRPVKPETARRVLDAAERIGFYGTAAIRGRVVARPEHLRLDFVLLRRGTPFYRKVGEALVDAAGARGDMRIRANLHFPEELTPRAIAAELRALVGHSDGVAVVASDHPLVSDAIAELAAAGTPVIALVTDLTAPLRRGYVGHDYWRIGRTAGWMVGRLARTQGKVGLVIGSHRYLSQEAMEIGFRSYFRERCPGFEILEPIASLEDPGLGCEATLELLARHPDLRGLYVAGGGVEGVFDALRDSRPPEGFVTVCMALTEGSAAALQEDLVQVVLSHPYRALAEAAVDTLVAAVARPADQGLLQVLLPFDVVTAENL